MKCVIHLMRLIRWPNLLIMALTMFMVRTFLILPYLDAAGISNLPTHFQFVMLVIAVVLVAAGGYIINDLYDRDIDLVNKPEKIIVGRSVTQSAAYFYYVVFTGLGLLLGGYLSIMFGQIHLFLIFLLMSGLLWFYARRYKRELILGNLVVAFSSAMVVLMVWLFDVLYLTTNPVLSAAASTVMPMINKLVFAYMLFAFLVSLVREIVKDIQDMKGDMRNECLTIPIKFGVSAARYISQLLLLVLLLVVAFWQFKMMQSGAMALFGYLFLVDGLMVLAVFALSQAKESGQFGQVSSLLKVLMLAGILSIPLLQFA